MRRELVNLLLAIAVLAITIVPAGAAVFVLGFVYGDSPCVMCWEQRIGMLLVALTGLFVLRYGPKPRYVGVALFIAAWGVHMAMRHVGLHAARDVGQGFSALIMGAHTYTWSLFIYWIVLATLALLLVLTRDGDVPAAPRNLGLLGTLAVTMFLVVTAGNIVQAFCSTGPPPYLGQSDPVRFSFRPANWIWSTEEWAPAPISWRGRWAIESPNAATASPDPSSGPFEAAPRLEVRSHRTLALPVRGGITDVAYDPASRRFLLTTDAGVYLVNETLDQVGRYTIVDTEFSVDLGRFAGASFLDSHTVLAVGENKSFVVLKESDEADAAKNFRFFVESADKFEEVSRGRFGTVRARMMYTMSAAFDPATNSIYTVTVPNAKTKRLVVSRFDRKDMTLSEEYSPAVGPGVALKKDASIDRLYVTGAAVADRRMYAISAAGSLLVAIDLPTRTVIGAYTIPGLDRPTGIAVKGDECYVIGQGGRVWVVDRPPI